MDFKKNKSSLAMGLNPWQVIRYNFIKSKLFSIFIFALLFLPSLLFAQKYHFKSYSVKEGLTNSEINTLFQDSKGFLWVGTRGGGICKFDGYSFDIPAQNSQLKLSSVTSIIEDQQGAILYSTEKQVCRIESNTAQEIELEAIKDQNLNGIKLIGDQLWALTNGNGVFVFGKKKGEYILLHQLTSEDGLRGQNIHDVAVDCQNRYWVGHEKGIDVVTFDDVLQISPMTVDVEIPTDLVVEIEEGDDCTMWFGYAKHGVYQIQRDTMGYSVKRMYNRYFDDNMDNNVSSLYVVNNHSVWLGTQYSGVINISFPFMGKLTSEVGMQSNHVTDIIEDRESNLWIATADAGIMRFSKKGFVHYDKNDGLTDLNIKSVVADSSDGIWIITEDNLYRLASLDDKIKLRYMVLPGTAELTYSNAMLIPNTQQLLAGTTADGFIHIVGSSFNRVKRPDGPTENIHVFYEEQPDVYLIGTDNGAYRYNTGDLNLNPNKKILAEKNIRTIISDKQSNIWFGTTTGLYVLQGENILEMEDDAGLTKASINCMKLNNEGHLLVGTMGNGILFIKNKSLNNNKVEAKTLLQEESMLSKNIYSMLWQNDTMLIAGTDRGFSQITTFNDSVSLVRNYNEANGFINTSSNLNAICKNFDGDVWFGTKTGISVFRPLRSKIDTAKPLINLDKFIVNDVARNTQQENIHFNASKAISLGHKQNFIDLAFSGIYYSNPITYRYKLEGLERKWNTTTDRFVSYPGLRPGNYVFQVQAITSTGVQTELYSLPFNIYPPLWQRPWFIIVFILSLIVLIISFYRYRVYKLEQDKIKLEMIVQERTEEILQQKLKIEAQKKDLTDSIKYAQRIQNAAITKPDVVQKYVKDYFIMFMPRDIVSGDFYWFGEVDNTLFVALADCTGHGVPGAFMSMLGLRLLNDIVINQKVTRTNLILDRLREGVIESLNQDDDEIRSKDGMDMSICAINYGERRIEFSGAFNPLWMIRNNELIVTKADRMPIAKYMRMEDFKANHIDFLPGDKIYFFTDGYVDQFRSGDLRKFMTKQLKHKIQEIAHLTMEEQRDDLIKTFEDWRGNYHQIDDVSLLGLQL